MASKITISKIKNPLIGTITLEGSKSISNRVLIIQALCEKAFHITGIAQAEDTELLAKNLQKSDLIYDVNHAGTSSRFLASFLTLQSGEQILTGSEQLKKRPIKPLIEALIQLGANINYQEKEGHLPIKIGESNWNKSGKVTIQGDISSQFISSLLLIAPNLPNGLELIIQGDLVSRPYVEMTLKCMEHFGISHQWEKDTIFIKNQTYQAKDFTVEADWSGASYYYSLVGAIPQSVIQLEGLHSESMQGDSAIQSIMSDIGVESTWNKNTLTLKHIPIKKTVFEYDFILCPDLAQSVISYCGIQGITGLFTGLKTLSIKETDRIKALQNELQKIEVFFSRLPQKYTKKSNDHQYLLEGKSKYSDNLEFETYHDHRMAMSLSVLAKLGSIRIQNPNVVNKSYPGFWSDLESLGINLSLSQSVKN